MCTEPVIRPPKPAALPRKRQSHSREFDTSVDYEVNDVENAYILKDMQDHDAIHDSASFKNMTFANVTNQIWHFSSVDHGPRCK